MLCQTAAQSSFFFTNKEIYFPKNKYLPKQKRRHIGLQKTASRKVNYGLS